MTDRKRKLVKEGKIPEGRVGENYFYKLNVMEGYRSLKIDFSHTKGKKNVVW